jgi:hypothetical protein
MFLLLVVQHRPKNAAFGQQKGQIHMSGFTLASCDYNRISQAFSDLISTESLEIPQDSFKIPSPHILYGLIKMKTRQTTLFSDIYNRYF